MIYISTNNNIFTFEDGANIVILSPKLYWFDTLSIPTNSNKKAKKIANNMLNSRPSNYKDISLFKKDDKFFVYCYDRENIDSLVKSLEIDMEEYQVYFLEELDISEPLKVNDDISLIPFENKIIENKINSDSNIKTLKEYLSKNPFDKKPLLNFKVDKSEINKLLLYINVALGLFVVLFIFSKVTTLNSIQKAIDNQQIKNKSSYEINSLISSFTKKDKTKMKFKKELKNMLSKNETIDSLEYKNNKFIISRAK